ncbi:RagB/SusD family nutrient uptake outer membrane protein [Puteibacter caeruleilacunae]|nr:RagB/SusD family nutrient uptake outer membrane protein [Puteibacter caeruleilacunae]
MKTIIYKLLFICIVVSALFTTSCVDEFEVGDDFLVKKPSGDVSIDKVFSDEVSAKGVLWNAYATLHYGLTDPTNYGTTGPEGLNALGDDFESFLNWGGTGITNYYSGVMNPSLENRGSKGYYAMSSRWKGIRNAYTFIENADKVPNFKAGEKERLVAESKMIIASHYANMFRHFGGLPLVKKAYLPSDDSNLERATVEETVNFITGLCDDAAKVLPWQIDNDKMAAWSGRFTAAGALGLKVRVLLFAASPLFNSSNTWDGYENESVTQKQSTYGNYDSNRWQKVVDACEEFFTRNGGNAPNSGIYYLQQATRAGLKGYREAYREAYYNRSNPGMLISVRRGDRTPSKWTYTYFPTIWVRWHGMVPTLTGLNAYAKANGAPFLEEDMPWKKSNEEQQAALDNSTYVDPFADRDPRLYEVSHISGKSSYSGRTFEGYMGGSHRGDKEDGSQIKTDAGFAPSGFSLYKWALDFAGEFGGRTIHWPELRLAEIYLSYAEALVMVGRSGEAYQWIDAVRERVGLKGILEANPDRKSVDITHPDLSVASPSDEFLLKEILRERKCEFALEDVRLYDLIRWRCAEDFKKRLTGLLIWRYKKSSDGTTVNDGASFVFNEFKIRKRFIQNGEQEKVQKIRIYPGDKEVSINKDPHGSMWEPKWYLSAFPTNEVNKSYGLTQNPGW